jgi:Protein of unknown function (DUF2510)
VAAEPPPAGWYKDPRGQGQRYWDGRQWTEHTHPAPAQQPAAPAQQAAAQQPAAAPQQPAPAQRAPARPAPAAQPGPGAPQQARPVAPQAPVAGTPLAARPAKPVVPIPPALWAAFAALVLMIIGGFGPYAEVLDRVTINGTDENAGDGWVVIGLAVIAGIFLAVWFANRARWQFIVAAVLGALSTIACIIDIVDINDVASSGLFAGADVADPAWGLYLATFGSLLLAIAAGIAAATVRR